MKNKKKINKPSIDQESINALSFLGVDMINKANSGHPGIVLGAAAPVCYLYKNFVNFHPGWINRDRFILSAGHGSALLYSLLHLLGILKKEDVESFRQLNSVCAGHPETHFNIPGIEATTGPLGQGVAMAVGQAISEKHLSAKYNKKGYKLFDHKVYALCGDGDLQEGVAMEAISLAGHLKLNNLILLFDSNDIQLDGGTEMATSTNHKLKFLSENWDYILVNNPYDEEEFNEAIKIAQKAKRPVLVELRTVIGKGVTNEATSKVHGSPIGEKERNLLAEKLGWAYKPFDIPEKVYKNFNKIVLKGEKKFNKYQELIKQYKEEYPEEYTTLQQQLKGKLVIPENFIESFDVPEKMATRKSSGMILDSLNKVNPNLIGGSADLVSSTNVKGADGDFNSKNYLGRNIRYGVREHAMAAINNGISLYGAGFIPFSSGFFVFSDYMKPAMRLSGLMNLKVVYIFTHDSVAVGEDGPTHQPIEQLISLRSIPNMTVIRPADFRETIGAYSLIGKIDGPISIILTRQNVTNFSNTKLNISQGGYILKNPKEYDLTVITSGSEVSLAMEVAETLKDKKIRVVSIPSIELFLNQDKDYQEKVLGDKPILAIEAGSSYSWYRFTQNVIGIDRYGISAPGDQVMSELGFNVESVINKIRDILK